MFYADYHIHSRVSPDGHASMVEMAEAAQKQGMCQICFTDHVENHGLCKATPGDTELFPLPEVAVKQIEAEYLASVGKFPQGIEVRVGMELGEVHHDIPRSEMVNALAWPDFIIGSLHNMREEEDFYFMHYDSEARCRTLMEQYMQELIEMARTGLFDVVGHIGYPVRYMKRQGFRQDITIREHGDALEELFRLLIENGRGIEINCSGLRPNDAGTTFPRQELICLYRDLGGEIITVGSDGHRTAQAAAHIAEGYECLRAAGFRYVTTFRKRKPEFVKL